MSTLEQLLTALLNGEQVDIEPRSRIEQYLKNCCDKCGCDNLPTPRSRVEILLYQLAEQLASGDTPEVTMIKAGLYQTGAIALYQEQGAEAISDMLITPWDELLANGTVHVEDGVVYTDADYDEGENVISDVLAGDLVLPNDGSIISLGDEVVFDEDYNVIGRFAFTYCWELTGILLPEGVTSIGEYAFEECDIKTIYLPVSVTKICAGAFYMTSLESITLPNTLPRIEDGTFFGCRGLTNIEIPNGVTSICHNAFSNCENIVSIIIPDSVTSIGTYAFDLCTSLANVYYTGTEEQWNAITIGIENESLTNATIHYNYQG